MRKSAFIRSVLASATCAAVLVTAPTALLGQGQSPAAASRTGAGTATMAAPRTPWGEPDIQGLWTSEPELGVPFERSKEFGERQTLTDAEFAARQAQAAKQIETDNADFEVETADTTNSGAVGSATSPPPHWLERGKPSRRTSLVIDPPDGRIPEVSAEARARMQRAVRGSFGNGPYNSHHDFTLYDRCITRGVPNSFFPAVYNANTRLVQGPGYVAITHEMIHETRIVPTDGRAAIPSSVRQYLGDARGYWDGDTLVVKTTNFNGKASYRGAGDKLVLTERFRRVDADTLRYEVTVEDSSTWARPWTAALNMKPQTDEMYEYACHEGNNSMRNMLSAARAAEKGQKAPAR